MQTILYSLEYKHSLELGWPEHIFEIVEIFCEIVEKNCGNFLAQIVEKLCGNLYKKPGFFLSPFKKSVIFLYFWTWDVEFMTSFYDFLKNLRIFDNFPKYFGGIFFTPYFSHFIAFLLLNISGQIVEKFHNCGKFGHPKRKSKLACLVIRLGAKIALAARPHISALFIGVL